MRLAPCLYFHLQRKKGHIGRVEWYTLWSPPKKELQYTQGMYPETMPGRDNQGSFSGATAMLLLDFFSHIGIKDYVFG